MIGIWTVLGVGIGRAGKHYKCQCRCGTISKVRIDRFYSGRNTACVKCNIHMRCRYHKENYAYNPWTAMKTRCFNPKDKRYCDYGGRGITVCERWKNSFDDFTRDMGPRPKDYELDRIDPDGNYEPSNCRWATKQENIANRRCSQKYKDKYMMVDINKLCECCLTKVKGQDVSRIRTNTGADSKS